MIFEDGFLDVIHCAELAGFDRRGGRRQSGHDHRHIGKRLTELLQHFDVPDVGQSKIGNHEIDSALPGQLQPFLARTGQIDAEACPRRARPIVSSVARFSSMTRTVGMGPYGVRGDDGFYSIASG